MARFEAIGPRSPESAKVELKRRGHSYRSAALHIGRSYQWICQVLNGQVKSRPVLEAVFQLPTRPNHHQN